VRENRRERLGEEDRADKWAQLVNGRERELGCWNWAKQAENEREGREMDFPFFIFSNLFSKAFTNLNFEQNFLLHKFTHHKI